LVEGRERSLALQARLRYYLGGSARLTVEMSRRIEALFGVIGVIVLGAGLHMVGARGAEGGGLERLRAARPERPGKAGGEQGSEIRELRGMMEAKRKALPKSAEVVEAEARAILRESLRTNRVSGDRVSAMKKEAKKEGKEGKAAREQARKVANEAKGGAGTGRRRD
jgi:hypothetical protein